MTERATRKRPFQHLGAGCSRLPRLRLDRLSVAAIAIILVSGSKPAVPGQARVTHSAAAADAVVAKLRELPLPIRRLPQGAASTKAPPPLPDLEARRQRVYGELHALGPASVPALARALHDPDPEMRRDVAVALDVVGGGWWQFPDGRPKLDLRPALPALLSALQDPDAGVRAWVAQDIGDIGQGAVTAVPLLRAMLHDSDPGSRGTACNALGAIGSGARSALPDLQRALSDSSPEVRQSARDAIVRIGRAALAQGPSR